MDLPEEEELRLTLNNLSAELHKLEDIHWICPLMQCSEEVCIITVLTSIRCCAADAQSRLTASCQKICWSVLTSLTVYFKDSVRSSKGTSSMKLKIIPKTKKEKEKLHKQKSNSSLSGKSSQQDSLFSWIIWILIWSIFPGKDNYGRRQII